MKIAKEIVAALSLDELFRKHNIDPGESPEEVIAAKLEPVREAFSEYVAVLDSEVYEALKLTGAQHKAREALALFEEE